ncbi:MAG: hypothetical protein A2821_03140 [Candidatus Magasanikbacteria bacterium RIFCSPHIGHO2_01_FULL_41_23]|uniref:Capsule polysaccharide biosynthesis protein n=1 Tax=Candidatus Magasanikbacteria bacterium RIFCSPLOWO2_01_FULL_40_15 TaxID=1798686 RepID=A0A1F6N3G3_9BACT|nr:MAG: hypothetical protein A2821_03140 [Candidatus Magasanikbacteria bacterium RIFCSPHIGHO2_01_FULL_41_23]OGH67333.1 MAG: hypothetical protein A3C66_01155 [Candidatus Magasanikbacteria bacterium RIFCSPHIGHO2_02_FULL_41_35]OGH76558.1 MAG: hypothetical protein A3F22_00365 [Candidatus Magasanikbacteria bacterium RIFCSPHIGHO2_12_FULL_41_16]OGH78457.1 MAG: hypothetical protein A2983_02990 [Candidatus Magasanikbacteria bacterium RIFCSPLOWO2_01_FULL_40_15]
MKGCFLLQRRFAYLGHAIIRSLKEQYGVTDFCGYVYQRSSYDFLRSQKDINYGTLLLDEDIHKKYKEEKVDKKYLAYLEETYGIPNLWPYLTIDRILMSNQLVREYPYDQPPFDHETMLRILQVHARTIETMLIEEKPDFVFASVVGGLGNLLLWEMAKKMGIKTLVTLPTCTGTRYLISEEYDSFTGAESLYELYKDKPLDFFKSATDFLAEFRNKPKAYSPAIPNYLKNTTRSSQFQFLRPAKLLRSVNWYKEILTQYREQRKNHDYSYDTHPAYYLVDHIKRKIRNAIGVNDLYDEFNPEEDFAFFPLHYEPEIALLLQAPWHTNQLNLINQIAHSLPVHYKLYIKEHPAMVEFRPRSFYKALKKNPNVKLINPRISSFDIIPYARLITTITGTVGWEATLLKKPVIMFGNQFYKFLSSVKKCPTMKELPYLVQEQLNNFVYNEDEVIRFVQAILDESIPINMTQLWEYEPDHEKKKIGLQSMVLLLAQKLNLVQK